MTAIQLKQKNPELDVLMLEKYKAYARNHVLQINPHCFNACQLDGDDTATQLLRQLQSKLQDQHYRIPCNELEEELRAIATAASITIRKGDGEMVMGIAPDHVLIKADSNTTHTCQHVPYDILIGADGAHSKTRKAIIEMKRREANESDNLGNTVMFSDLSQVDEDTEFDGGQHIINHRVRVKYRIQQDTGRMDSSFGNYVRLVYPTTKWLGSIVHEHISQDEDGNHWVTADFFIDQDEYDSLKQGGHDLKNPASLNNQELPATLRRKIETWQAVKHGYCGEVKIPDSEKISPYFIGSFHAEQPCHITTAGKLVFLSGDALTSLAFMRAFNNCLHNSAYAGDQIACLDTCSLEEIVDRIALHARLRYKKELFTAGLKKAAVDFLLWFLNISNKVPWQTNRFTAAEIDQLIDSMNRAIASQGAPDNLAGAAGFSTDDVGLPTAPLIAV
ncbi:hypothetical protein GCM10023116_30100 [Kistimonas scapharcae]|uniref:FAD-binding domain-containing protein n=2 Tax=Kistimonas scapharcae TaxID=1036133 RepID=A0ABP8V4B0_9GAMM